jgi:hypothetical protein
MRNGNPITATSWANFLFCFGEAFGIDSTGPVDCGPGHNTSYKRAVLEHYAGELERLYQSERMFHYRLRGDGHTILAEPRAELAHVNISILREAIAHAFLGGVLFGEYRAKAMGTAEKVARSVLAPLVPLLRLWRLLTTAGYRRIADNGSPPRALVLLPLLLVGHAAGEVAGYLAPAARDRSPLRTLRAPPDRLPPSWRRGSPAQSSSLTRPDCGRP